MATVTYDHMTDTLYIRYVDRAAHKGVEDPAGVIRRYDEEGNVLGVTILDFTHRLMGGNYILGEQTKCVSEGETGARSDPAA